MAEASELKPHPDNAHRSHPPKQLDRYEAVIAGNGWRKSVVVSKRSGFIVKGHGAWESARRRGWKIPIEVQQYASLAEERRDLIADNRLAQDAVTDEQKLAQLLSEMDVEDVALTGYDRNDIDSLLSQLDQSDVDAEPQIDKAAELAAKWKTKRGQIWELGNHRLMCGDSTKTGEVQALLTGEKLMIMVTDPPYGVNYCPQWRAEAGVNKNRGKMGAIQNDDKSDWTAAWQLFPGNVAYVYHDGRMAGTLQASLLSAGLVIRNQIIWAKDRMALSRGDYHWQHEPCWYAVSATGCLANGRTIDLKRHYGRFQPERTLGMGMEHKNPSSACGVR